LATIEKDALQDRVVHIARVAKVVKGGRRFSFSALIVVGDGKERVGFGLGKAGEVPDAIRKGADQARKDLVSVTHANGTIPFEVVGAYGSTKVTMYPAKKGKGIIAGGPARTIFELSGISDIVCKIHGSKNYQNVVRATFDGLSQLVPVAEYCERRGFTVEQVLQKRGDDKAHAKAL
jgi:small subunit ribosomal protein S5